MEAGVIVPGSVIWLDVLDSIGREQSGRRPWVVVSSRDFLAHSPDLLTAIPCTSRDRKWPHHVRLTGETGLPFDSFAMTEQVRTLSRERVPRISGLASFPALREIMGWVHDWLEPAA